MEELKSLNTSKPVKDLTTGACYRSIKRAAAELGSNAWSVSQAIAKGKTLNGHKLAFADFQQVRSEGTKRDKMNEERPDDSTLILSCLIFAIKVDFIATKKEVSMYANALYDAIHWAVNL